MDTFLWILSFVLSTVIVISAYAVMDYFLFGFDTFGSKCSFCNKIKFRWKFHKINTRMIGIDYYVTTAQCKECNKGLNNLIRCSDGSYIILDDDLNEIDRIHKNELESDNNEN